MTFKQPRLNDKSGNKQNNIVVVKASSLHRHRLYRRLYRHRRHRRHRRQIQLT